MRSFEITVTENERTFNHGIIEVLPQSINRDEKTVIANIELVVWQDENFVAFCKEIQTIVKKYAI